MFISFQLYKYFHVKLDGLEAGARGVAAVKGFEMLLTK